LTRRLLIPSAGSGPSNNLIRSLTAGDSSFFIVGCHDDRFVLKKSLADRNYLIPASSQPGFRRALQRIIKTERIDLAIPDSDHDVRTFSALRGHLTCRTFLPSKRVIELCQDKYKLTMFLRRRGLPAPRTYPVRSLEKIDELFRRLAPYSLLWCRIREGSGSFGAIPVKSSDQARAWIKYWGAMREVPKQAFTISEYLPGRDFCVESLWRKGTLILTKMAERLAYIDNGSPSGVSSTPALAKTVLEPRVVEVCAKAIRALGPKVSGVFFLDVKEDALGAPCITEINAGRFPMITGIHDLTGKYNMAAIYVRLAFGEPVRIREACDFAPDCYLVRSLDTLPVIFKADELFEGIEDARE
jgi:carbamoylphosphate synthase large subunit